MGAVLVIEALKFYLWGRDTFILKVDASCLSTLKKGIARNQVLERAGAILAMYRFTVEHVKGVTNVLSDLLSRLPCGPVDDDSLERLTDERFAGAVTRSQAKLLQPVE